MIKHTNKLITEMTVALYILSKQLAHNEIIGQHLEFGHRDISYFKDKNLLMLKVNLMYSSSPPNHFFYHSPHTSV